MSKTVRKPKKVEEKPAEEPTPEVDLSLTVPEAEPEEATLEVDAEPATDEPEVEAEAKTPMAKLSGTLLNGEKFKYLVDVNGIEGAVKRALQNAKTLHVEKP